MSTKTLAYVVALCMAVPLFFPGSARIAYGAIAISLALVFVVRALGRNRPDNDD
jgi:hypothetical protein